MDWRFFLFCGNKVLPLEKTAFSCRELIFAIFWKSRSHRTDLFEYMQKKDE